jgi:hypothetical protein
MVTNSGIRGPWTLAPTGSVRVRSVAARAREREKHVPLPWRARSRRANLRPNIVHSEVSIDIEWTFRGGNKMPAAKKKAVKKTAAKKPAAKKKTAKKAKK